MDVKKNAWKIRISIALGIFLGILVVVAGGFPRLSFFLSNFIWALLFPLSSMPQSNSSGGHGGGELFILVFMQAILGIGAWFALLVYIKNALQQYTPQTRALYIATRAVHIIHVISVTLMAVLVLFLIVLNFEVTETYYKGMLGLGVIAGLIAWYILLYFIFFFIVYCVFQVCVREVSIAEFFSREFFKKEIFSKSFLMYGFLLSPLVLFLFLIVLAIFAAGARTVSV